MLAAWRKAGQRCIAERQAWERRFAALPAEQQSAFRRATAGKLTSGWQAPLNAFKRKLAVNSRSGRPARPPGRRWRSSPPPSRR